MLSINLCQEKDWHICLAEEKLNLYMFYLYGSSDVWLFILLIFVCFLEAAILFGTVKSANFICCFLRLTSRSAICSLLHIKLLITVLLLVLVHAMSVCLCLWVCGREDESWQQLQWSPQVKTCWHLFTSPTPIGHTAPACVCMCVCVWDLKLFYLL